MFKDKRSLKAMLYQMVQFEYNKNRHLKKIQTNRKKKITWYLRWQLSEEMRCIQTRCNIKELLIVHVQLIKRRQKISETLQSIYIKYIYKVYIKMIRWQLSEEKKFIHLQPIRRRFSEENLGKPTIYININDQSCEFSQFTVCLSRYTRNGPSFYVL